MNTQHIHPGADRTIERSRSQVHVARYNTVVIGGGQAGLAVGQQLALRGLDFIILDAEARIGDAWRRRWDSLRLFTPAERSGLPDMVFPAPPAHLPDKDAVAAYLEQYAERFELPLRNATHVDSLHHDGARFVIGAGDATFEADNVIVATGPFQRPRIPAVSASLGRDIHQLHSSEYHNPFMLPEGPVLVAGAGPSGAQIALELSRFRKVWLAGPNTGHLPRRLLGRDVFAWIWPLMTRATTDTHAGRRLRKQAGRGGDRLIGLPEKTLADAGVLRVGRVTEARGGLPVCDGAVLHPRVVLWCTGFASDYRWIDLPAFGSDGEPRHDRGVSADIPGLFFVGLKFQHRMTSSLIGGVGLDATYVAEQVARRAEVAADV